ncbi:cytochrome C peroxidase [Erythrobacter sp. SG61-1L]|uniref:cytochrome-c peroxidase n=1 Tax=Erythrobacter sp. SG61-1L TaxID=1603897 RepID=UPI0006C9017E|nr:cytochrome c peroxidase [Erythrobacter sp. SG61-1L]KPL66775.1 cytochrome C peroxidase [Erythrobacter sp. SG61-1L]
MNSRHGKWIRLASLLGAGLLLAGAAGEPEPVPPASELRMLYAGKPQDWPRPTLHDGAVFEEFGPLPARPTLEGRDAQMAQLGEELFNERRLSGSGQFACASCHNRELGMGDGLRTAFGHDRQRGSRNSQQIFTAGLMHEWFWDGRAATLEDQAIAAMTNPIEMAGEPARIEEWINSDDHYREKFAALQGEGRITLQQIVGAIAAFQKSLRPPRSKWDRMLEDGPQVFTDEELTGLHLFRTKAGCANCHNGPLFSDQRYHNIGLTYYGRKYEDLGRYLLTGKAEDVGRFRTPSLRAAGRTGPYMHNGLFPSLLGIVNLYNAGGVTEKREASLADPAAPRPALDPLVKELNLTAEERRALVAFLETL